MKIAKYLDALESFQRLLRNANAKTVADDTRWRIEFLSRGDGPEC